MHKQALALLSSLSLLTGCGQVTVFGHVIGDKHPATVVESTAPSQSEAAPPVAAKPTAPASPPAAHAHAVNGITLTLSPQATQTIAADARFDVDILKAAVLDELRSRHLLDEATTGTTADIAIDHLAVQPTSNAVLFGYVLSEGQLYGDVRTSDGVRTQRVEAHTRLSISEKSPPKEPLAPLYRRFAAMTADALAGVESTQPDDPVNNQRYR